MSITATRRVQFCAGHRVFGHENKCAHLHGHNYVALLTAEVDGPLGRSGSDRTFALDSVGRVIDFSALKEKVGGWIDANWDHGFILYAMDTAVHAAVAAFTCDENGVAQKVYHLPTNPTAELLAHHLLHVVGPRVLEGTGVRLVRVELWETENCRAEVAL